MMIEKNSDLILVRPRTWTDDIKQRFPQLFREMGPFHFTVGEGWKGIITALCEKLELQNNPDLRIVRIKEKFGELRVAASGGNEEIHAWILQARYDSGSVCEQCGAPGEQIEDGWVFTLCEACNTKRVPPR